MIWQKFMEDIWQNIGIILANFSAFIGLWLSFRSSKKSDEIAKESNEISIRRDLRDLNKQLVELYKCIDQTFKITAGRDNASYSHHNRSKMIKKYMNTTWKEVIEVEEKIGTTGSNVRIGDIYNELDIMITDSSNSLHEYHRNLKEAIDSNTDVEKHFQKYIGGLQFFRGTVMGGIRVLLAKIAPRIWPPLDLSARRRSG